MYAGKAVTLTRSRFPYYSALVVFLVSLALILLTMVDIRRGFLFLPDYFKVGTPSVLLYLNAAHVPLLLAGVLGIWLAYTFMKRFEKGLAGSVHNLKTAAVVFAVIILILLVVDLFTYRGVPASRTLETGKMNPGAGIFGQGLAIPVTKLPGWLQPFGDGINYLLLVWHATALGIVLGGLFLVAAGAGLIARLKGTGFGAHLFGAAMAIPTPFCSCCAAPIGSALYRKGASLGPVLAYTIAAPMLNVTSLILAVAILPPDFALLRIAGGIIVAVFLTFLVSLIASRWIKLEKPETETSRDDRVVSWAEKVIAAYSRLFQFDKLLVTESPESPSALISSWMKMTGRLARVVVPIFLITAPLTAYIVRLMPDTANNVIGVTVTSFFATLLMAPTWSEIAFAGGMITKGFPALAAASLIALPAVSIPCLLIIGGAVGKIRVAVITGFAVFLAAVAAGIIFL